MTGKADFTEEEWVKLYPGSVGRRYGESRWPT